MKTLKFAVASLMVVVAIFSTFAYFKDGSKLEKVVVNDFNGSEIVVEYWKEGSILFSDDQIKAMAKASIGLSRLTPCNLDAFKKSLARLMDDSLHSISITKQRFERPNKQEGLLKSAIAAEMTEVSCLNMKGECLALPEPFSKDELHFLEKRIRAVIDKLPSSFEDKKKDADYIVADAIRIGLEGYGVKVASADIELAMGTY